MTSGRANWGGDCPENSAANVLPGADGAGDHPPEPTCWHEVTPVGDGKQRSAILSPKKDRENSQNLRAKFLTRRAAGATAGDGVRCPVVRNCRPNHATEGNESRPRKCSLELETRHWISSQTKSDVHCVCQAVQKKLLRFSAEAQDLNSFFQRRVAIDRH